MKDLGFSNTTIFTGNKDHGFVNTIFTGVQTDVTIVTGVKNIRLALNVPLY